MSEYREITPECRANRGAYPAYDQAVHDLWHVYGVMLHRHPDATFVLTLARKPDAAASAVEDCEQHRKRADQAEELLSIAHETSNRSEAERARAVQRAETAEALLLRFAAEAHRRKWDYDRGLDGDGVPLKSEAFDALHRLGEEMRTALEELRRAHGTEVQRCDAGFVFGGRCVKPAGHQPPHEPAAEVVPCLRPEPHSPHSHSGLRKGIAVHGRCPGGEQEAAAADDEETSRA